MSFGDSPRHTSKVHNDPASVWVDMEQLTYLADTTRTRRAPFQTGGRGLAMAKPRAALAKPWPGHAQAMANSVSVPAESAALQCALLLILQPSRTLT